MSNKMSSTDEEIMEEEDLEERNKKMEAEQARFEQKIREYEDELLAQEQEE